MQTTKDIFKKSLPEITGLVTFIVSVIVATSVSVWLAASFTEPGSGPVGFTQPVGSNASGTIRVLIGTSNSTTQGTDTLFNYLRKIDDSPTAYAEPSVGDTGFIEALMGSANPSTADGSTLFNYLKRIEDNVVWGTAYPYGDNDPDYVLSTADSPGLALKNTWEGSADTLVADYTLYTQAKGGVSDQYSTPADTYGSSTPWTQCTSGNSYCGTNDSTACSGDVCWKDGQTGLIWSDCLEACAELTWFEFHDCYEPGTAENPGSCSANGDDACKCVKKTSSNVGCGALGDGSWRMAHQKEWLQMYINGGVTRLSNSGSAERTATTRSNGTHESINLHSQRLETGYTNKENPARRSRCVRP